ncbi:hypothetical protein CH373_06300 [Leptospira perolatii]|uniref:Uncharacterized protein n=1 Tax=Leptospira perolatii TaxID=2023191 RepID=A0A2M9ZNV2_9LEPT|nr:hypothetical protein CH360_05030 [Leptospira perolatii]PJZ73768.1 hypothetical protein CH373_06300 [Leptospira perolatii]
MFSSYLPAPLPKFISNQINADEKIQSLFELIGIAALVFLKVHGIGLWFRNQNDSSYFSAESSRHFFIKRH